MASNHLTNDADVVDAVLAACTREPNHPVAELARLAFASDVQVTLHVGAVFESLDTVHATISLGGSR